MPEPKPISPLLDGFAIGEPISDHHGVRCCPAIREDTGERFILKIISVPASQVQVDALFLTGVFSAHFQALSYFEELSKSILGEVEILSKLTALEGFLPYSGSQLVEMDEGIGYEVYLISPYKRSLRKQMQLAPLTHLGAVNLALDLCAALAASRRAGYLYVDLKPENIFLTPNQGWRIGDLGFVSLSSLKYASLQDKYRSEYTAPEISDAMSQLNDTIDIYALGLVLYQVYNNGQLPAGAATPGEIPQAPMYADYELAEIIMKACDPDPSKRWTNPGQMGQAIVAYMQRNSINDTPIVPPPVELPPEPEIEPVEDFLNENENEAELEEMMKDLLEEEPQSETPPLLCADEDISFMEESNADETVPSEESAAELEDVSLSQEVEQMLAQADELISHELPEPVVAPEPIDVPFPAPIVLEGDNSKSDSDSSDPVALLQDSDETDENTCFDLLMEVDTPEQHDSETDDSSAPEADAPTELNDPDSTDANEREYKKKKNKSTLKVLISIASVLLLLVAASFGTYFLYQEYYLQNINSITLNGDVHALTVHIHSEIEDSLLSVTCTDTYGNTRSSAVSGGVAHFTSLTPNTQYRIQVNISGTHRLTGNTSSTFTTPAQTEIMNFNAIAGPEDGSVILSFAVNGPEPESWIMDYSAENEAEQTATFAGHTITISGLTVGADYTFKLNTAGNEFLTGSRELDYTAQKIIYAQDLHLTECGNGSIRVAWSIPEGTPPQKWLVRCYSDEGFDETITTTDTLAQFTVPNHEYQYTVDVTAEGMTCKTPITISANPITITQIKADVSDDGTLNLMWTFSGNPPASGWTFSYSIDGTAAISIDCTANEATLPYYPGSHYDFDICPSDETTYLSDVFSYDAPKAQTFEKYRVTAEEMSFKMCLTPDKEDWDRHDVADDDYRKKFSVGEKASFLVKLEGDRKKSKDGISVSYIVRDENGAPISLDTETTTWNRMWDNRYCELNIPRMPTVTGKYTIEIYFNGYHVTTKNFSII